MDLSVSLRENVNLVQVYVELFIFTAGLWGVFKKCGEKPWKALIPFYKYYVLGLCADRELEGRALFMIEIVSFIFDLIARLVKTSSVVSSIFVFLLLTISIVDVIYRFRVFTGLAENFGRKKIWILLWTFFEFICALLWGFLKMFQPQWQVKDIQKKIENFFDGGNVAVLDEGLTVNLKERTEIRSFKKYYFLRDIHLEIHPGKLVLLLGGSGSGKTTLVNAINGYEKANAEIMLNGINVYDEYDKMKYDIGFVPQQDLMRGNDTVLRTLMDSSTLRLPANFDKEKRKERVESVLDMFGLTPVKDSLVEKLSGGQRKRLSIAMEFISNPTLFILDEPDSGLDGVMARELMEQLRKIADQGKIVIVITHTPDRVIDLFDEVIVLAKDENFTGRLAYYGDIPGARKFFGREKMEEIVKSINHVEEGGDGLADEFIKKFAEMRNE